MAASGRGWRSCGVPGVGVAADLRWGLDNVLQVWLYCLVAVSTVWAGQQHRVWFGSACLVVDVQALAGFGLVEGLGQNVMREMVQRGFERE